MGDVVNLNQFRKQRRRREEERRAAENRRRAGRTKSERVEARLEIERRDRTLDDKRLDPPEGDDTPEAG